MVYFIIPIKNFENEEEMIGKTSKDILEAEFVIDNNNKEVILSLFKYFGIFSKRHKFDVIEILNILIKNFK